MFKLNETRAEPLCMDIITASVTDIQRLVKENGLSLSKPDIELACQILVDESDGIVRKLGDTNGGLFTYIEKMKPIEEKMKPQIEKLLNRASQEKNGANSKTNLRVRLENMDIDDEGSEEETSDNEHNGDVDKQKEVKKYVVPRIRAVRYEEEEEAPNKKAKRRAMQSSLIMELKNFMRLQLSKEQKCRDGRRFALVRRLHDARRGRTRAHRTEQTPVDRSNDFQSARTFYLYYVDLPRTVRGLIEYTCKLVRNLILRQRHERTENKSVLDKDANVQPIIENIRASEQLDEPSKLAQIAEVEEMYLPAPDRVQLNRFRRAQATLLAAQDQSIRVLLAFKLFLASGQS